MKKPLTFLSALLLSSAATVTTTACNHQTNAKYNFKDFLKKIDLDVIPEENPGTIPTDSELDNQIYNLNHSLNIKNITITGKTADHAFVVGDGIFYTKDKIKITYQEQTIDISTMIVDGVNIGNFKTAGTPPDFKDVQDRIHQNYANIKMENIIINNISNSSATIEGDNKLYTGKVTVKFSTSDSVDLSTIIDKDKLLPIKTGGKDIPTSEQVITALHNMYKEKLNTSVIVVKDIKQTSATIDSTNPKIYTGEVTVKLNLDISIPLKDEIKKPSNKIAIIGNVITEKDVTNSLKKQYPDLKPSAIKVVLNDNIATISTVNKSIYTGDNVVIKDLVIDLSSVLPKTLPTFKTSGKDAPNKKQIIAALKLANPNLDLTKVTINDITDKSVTIIGDGKVYSKDSVVVTYNCDKSMPLSDVFTNLNLGTINTNGVSTPTVEAVTKAIAAANPKLNMDAIKFSATDITTKTVTVTGDDVIYNGSVVANFVVDSSTISIPDFAYNHSETNSVGSLKTTWVSPDITVLSNWTNYAPDWVSFTNKFSKLSFGDKSYFSVYCNGYTNQKLAGSKLDVATTNISSDRNVNTFKLNYYHDDGFFGCYIDLDGYIHIWHDDKNVYVSINWSIDTIKCFYDRVWDVNLQGVNFG